MCPEIRMTDRHCRNTVSKFQRVTSRKQVAIRDHLLLEETAEKLIKVVEGRLFETDLPVTVKKSSARLFQERFQKCRRNRQSQKRKDSGGFQLT